MSKVLKASASTRFLSFRCLRSNLQRQTSREATAAACTLSHTHGALSRVPGVVSPGNARRRRVCRYGNAHRQASLVTYDDLDGSGEASVHAEQVEGEQDAGREERRHGDELHPAAAVARPPVPHDGADKRDQRQHLQTTPPRRRRAGQVSMRATPPTPSDE